MRLLVIIPAFDEAATVADVIARVPRRIPGVSTVDVLVVDDGSRDDTAAVARAHGAEVVRHARNMGVGKAMQTGLGEAVRRGADLAVNIDADGQFAPEDIPALLAPIVAGEAEVVSASRFKDPALVPEMPRVKRLGNRVMAWLVSRLTGECFQDVSCGFRAYAREAVLRLTLIGRFTYTHEMFLALSHHGLRLVELPIRVRGMRAHGRSRVASNLVRYGYQTLRIIFGFVRDYRPELFFNAIAGGLFVPGLGLATFFVVHRTVTGSFSPHIWAGFAAAYVIGIALVLFVFGQLGAMISRTRMLHEEQLYLLRRLFTESYNASDGGLARESTRRSRRLRRSS